MLVFIGWQGDRSRAIAQALRDWLRKVIQATDPWISTDLKKGSRWSPEIAERLKQAKAGIFCLTSDNLDSKWMHFEAGAISNIAGPARVCTFLMDVKGPDVEGPLTQFQHTTNTKEELFQLAQNINSYVLEANEKPLEQEVLRSTFDSFWDELQNRLKEAPRVTKSVKPRPEADVLDEILETVRRIDRTSGGIPWVNTRDITFPEGIQLVRHFHGDVGGPDLVFSKDAAEKLIGNLKLYAPKHVYSPAQPQSVTGEGQEQPSEKALPEEKSKDYPGK